MDQNTGCVYRVIVNKAALVKTFTSCHMAMTRTAILNYVIIRQKSLSLAKKVTVN